MMRTATSPSRTPRPSSAAARAVALTVVASMLVACGSANVNVLKRYQGMRLPAPSGIVVYPFDESGNGLDPAAATDAESAPDDQARRREVARVLSKQLVKELEDRGLPASLGTGTLAVPEGSMAVGGRIVTVDPGSQMGRIFIGFGYGRSRISSVATLEGRKDGEQLTLLEFQNTAKSGPKPGILTTLPIGFLVNGVTLLGIVLSGGMAGIGELSASVGADAKHTADELAKAIAKSLSQVAYTN